MLLSCKRQEAPIGATSGTELVLNIVDLGSTNWCPAGFTPPTYRTSLTYFFFFSFFFCMIFFKVLDIKESQEYIYFYNNILIIIFYNYTHR